MKTIRLLAVVGGCLCAVASVTAQENIRLHFELYKNRKQFGIPAVAVTVRNSETGSVELRNTGDAKLSFTPTRINTQTIEIAFVIVAGRNTLKPHVTLLKGESGWLSWKSGSDSFDVRVFVVPREVAAAR